MHEGESFVRSDRASGDVLVLDGLSDFCLGTLTLNIMLPLEDRAFLDFFDLPRTTVSSCKQHSHQTVEDY